MMHLLNSHASIITHAFTTKTGHTNLTMDTNLAKTNRTLPPLSRNHH